MDGFIESHDSVATSRFICGLYDPPLCLLPEKMSTTRLARLGVRAIYGNDVYRRLQPGLIYSFKISATGDLILESTPAI